MVSLHQLYRWAQFWARKMVLFLRPFFQYRLYVFERAQKLFRGSLEGFGARRPADNQCYICAVEPWSAAYVSQFGCSVAGVGETFDRARRRPSGRALGFSVRAFVRMVSVGSTSCAEALPNARFQSRFQRATHL